MAAVLCATVFIAIALVVLALVLDANPYGDHYTQAVSRIISNINSSVKHRILDYNEDGSRATRVLLNVIRTLERSLHIENIALTT
jgi:hypothetical protein